MRLQRQVLVAIFLSHIGTWGKRRNFFFFFFYNFDILFIVDFGINFDLLKYYIKILVPP